MKRIIAAAILALVSSACGSDAADPAAACEDLVVITCDKFYSCLTEGERELLGLPLTEDACVSDLTVQYGCAEQTLDTVCDDGGTYQADQADDCLDQLAALECSEARDGLEGDTPACDQICQVE